MTSVVQPSAAPGTVGGLRTDAGRFEIYVRLSLYVILAFEVLVAAIIVGAASRPLPGLIAYGAGMVVQTGLNVAVWR